MHNLVKSDFVLTLADHVSEIMKKHEDKNWKWHKGFSRPHVTYPMPIGSTKYLNDGPWISVGMMKCLLRWFSSGLRIHVYLITPTKLMFELWHWIIQKPERTLYKEIIDIASSEAFDRLECLISRYTQMKRLPCKWDKWMLILGIGEYAKLEKWYWSEVCNGI